MPPSAKAGMASGFCGAKRNLAATLRARNSWNLAATLRCVPRTVSVATFEVSLRCVLLAFSAATCEVGLRCVDCAFLALTWEVDLRCVVRVFSAPTLGVNDFDMILDPRYAAIVAVRGNVTTDIPHYVPHRWREPGPLSSCFLASTAGIIGVHIAVDISYYPYRYHGHYYNHRRYYHHHHRYR